MKRIALVLVILAIVVTTTAASESLKAIVDAYTQIQSQLAADKIDDIKGPARAIAGQAATMGKNGQALAKAANAIEAAKDLKGAREAFGPLTDAVMAAGKAEGWKDVEGVRIGFCPMASKPWLQKEEQVRNPYYGSLMLTCGELKPLK
jgi:hypothetical protein